MWPDFEFRTWRDEQTYRPCEKHSQVIVHLPPAVSNVHGAWSSSHARISSYAHSLATSNEQERIFRRSNMGTLSIS
jgi:hypothetical protein